MLSQRTRYTIRALLHLADRYGEGPVQLSEIAARQNIPSKFLTVMLSQMIREKLVASRRGRDGGYWLAKPPAEISYGSIVRLTRGSLGLLPCASRYRHETCKNCITEDQCRLHRVMLMVRDETARILDGLSLADSIPEDAFADGSWDAATPLPRKAGEASQLEQYPEQSAAAVACPEADRAAMGEDDLAGEA